MKHTVDANATVLIVDDDPFLRRALSDVLRVAGHSPTAAETGKAGLDLAEQERPAVALIDLNLPDMPGLEVLRGIAARSPETERVVLTGHASQESAIEAVNLGAYSYVLKPYEMDHLLLTIRRAIEKRDAEEALRESQQRYQQLFDSANDMVFVSELTSEGSAGKLIEVNREACRRLGFTREELLKTAPVDLAAPESRDDFPELAKRLAVDKRLLFETVAVAKDGTKLPVEVNANLIEVRGRPAVLSIARDIAERKRAEEERAKLDARLRQAQRLEILGTVVATIAHDFNNMLQPILNYAEMARAELSPDSQPWSDLGHVLEAVSRASDLVARIQAFSRPGEDERVPLRLHHIVRRAVKLARAAIPTTMEVRERLDRRCGIVLADPTQIHQVVMNLCTNAAHAMRESGGTLDVRLDAAEVDAELAERHPSLHEGTYVRLTVSDTGLGMDGATTETSRRLATSGRVALSPTSPPKKGGKGPAWVCSWSTASWRATAATSPWTASREREPRARSICPSMPSRPVAPDRESRGRSRSHGGPNASCLSTTTR